MQRLTKTKGHVGPRQNEKNQGISETLRRSIGRVELDVVEALRLCLFHELQKLVWDRGRAKELASQQQGESCEKICFHLQSRHSGNSARSLPCGTQAKNQRSSLHTLKILTWLSSAMSAQIISSSSADCQNLTFSVFPVRFPLWRT